MKIPQLLFVSTLCSCQLIFLPSPKRFAESFANNCFDGVDNDGKNGIDCEDPVCDEICNDDQLTIGALTSNNCVGVQHDAVTGDDRGMIALGSGGVIYSGDIATASFDINSLESTPQPNLHFLDGAFSDLRSGKIYTLVDSLNASIIDDGPPAVGFSEIDLATGTLGAPTPFVGAVSLNLTGGAIFSGKGRVVLLSDGELYDVNIATAEVTSLGVAPPMPHQSCENKSFGGVAEFAGTQLSLVYPQDPHTIVRTPIGATTTPPEIVGQFGSLGDMCSFSVAPRGGRWYFHVEDTNSFFTGAENMGYCDALFTPRAEPAVCGDGFFQAPEACDDGNTFDNDGCTNCKLDVCGDGVLNQKLQGTETEACDDGNNTSADGCSADCKSLEVCGNFIVDTAIGETCDDGNNVDNDGCDADCTFPCFNTATSPGLKMSFLDTATNRCYAVFEFVDIWESDRQNCINHGGELASINSSTEQDLVLPASVFTPWIGFNDATTEGDFAWSDVSALGFTNFAAGEPNNTNDEDCVSLNADGTWNDSLCLLGKKSICEFDCNVASCQ